MIQIRTIVISVLLVPLVLTAELVNAQETTTPPFNVAVPVDSVATLFSELYGPNGLIVDSLAVPTQRRDPLRSLQQRLSIQLRPVRDSDREPFGVGTPTVSGIRLYIRVRPIAWCVLTYDQ